MPGRAALLALLITTMVSLSLILLGAPSWATSRRHRQSPSAQPIKLRTLLLVNTTSDESTPGDGFCSLREAITTSNDAGGFTNDCGTGSGFDTIEFSVSGTITLGSALPALANNLIIDGTGQSVTIDGASMFQVFTVNSGATLTLSDLTVQNGSGGLAAFGGGIVNNGMLTLNNCAILDSFAGFGGAGIYNTSMLTITNSTISHNGTSKTDDGGGINNSGTLNITNSNFSGNAAAAGGAVENAGGMMTVTNSTFSGNTALAGGGIVNSGSLTIGGSTFSGNSATGDAGGIANASSGTISVTNSTFASNNAGTQGGGIDNGGVMIVVNSTISGNSAPSGKGGGVLTSNQITFKNTIVANSTDGGNCSFAGTFTSDGHNLSDDLTCFFVNTGDVNNMPVGLDPKGLQNNGGPTQTIALLPAVRPSMRSR